MKKPARAVISGLVFGALFVGSALAAGGAVSGLLPTPAPSDAGGPSPTSAEEPAAAPTPEPAVADTTASSGFDEELGPEEIVRVAAQDVSVPGMPVPEGTFLVGASRATLHPAPDEFGGEVWQTERCTTYGTDGPRDLDHDHALPPADPADPVATADELRSWPVSSPDCIYLGGFGIGPVRPAQRVGRGGVWVRTVAISNGSETFIYAIADTVGWFARYDPTICSDCGILDVRQRLVKDLGIDAGDVVIGSTHSHATADTYGGWGGIPDWYRDQLRDATIASAKQSILNMVPATITVGETQLPQRNNERRDTYYSNVDVGAPWLQAKTLPVTTCDGPGESEGHSNGDNQTCTTGSRTIATWSTFAGHPTIVDAPILHADWPGAAARRFESLYGGVGLVFEGGLGNASISGAGGNDDEAQAENTGIAFADEVAASIADDGTTLGSNTMAASVKDFEHPVQTNPGITTLAAVGLFDREFIPGTPGAGPPGVYGWSKAGEFSTSEQKPPPGSPTALRSCVSQGPTVRTVAGAHRIGDFLIAFTPGEIFSNIAEIVKERADRARHGMVLGQTNDALGYIIQSFEFDLQGNVVTEYGTQTGEYEEVFATDRCIGDHVLEVVLTATAALGFGR